MCEGKERKKERRKTIELSCSIFSTVRRINDYIRIAKSFCL